MKTGWQLAVKLKLRLPAFKKIGSRPQPRLSLLRHAMNAIHPLAKETVRFLNSGQVITDLSTIVKELVENALDANASSIEVKLVDYGLSAITVKDNGSGIPESDRKQMAKRFCTSKLESFESLNSVLSYGFRGEALNSICAVSKETQIVTKTKEDAVAKLYELDVTGSIVSEKSNVGGIGTTVTAKKPFYNIPVRRQLAQKNAPQTASKIQDLLIAYGLVHPKVRFVLLHTQETVGNKKKPQNWIKPAVADQMEDVKVIFGKTLADMLDHVSIEEAYNTGDIDNPQEEAENLDDEAIRLDAVLPIKGSDPIIVCKGDHVYIYINSRPIQASKSDLKELLSLAE
ncbi:hypothetical protein K450DRAFT_204368 [Umbelopsis ramanniana AG]|uniref:Uncharacterized protein n=1 Tax=Umbelopsis ramanniana AG TaxID=1314678 RepID=A0AAD5EID1_UMBRA|nr:uncharacterized protein K450DRAFT_204368 [Umbelopsis ramanniana AG]KAI8583957.1 hypothetical protein K450DRAFT_204368 [Umbelopsis ramanniana AG]